MSHEATTYPQGTSWRNLGHISSYPNFVGSEQLRTYSFADGKLTLSYVNGNGNGGGPKGLTSRLVWVRY
jgi:hypothetical protein